MKYVGIIMIKHMKQKFKIIFLIVIRPLDPENIY